MHIRYTLILAIFIFDITIVNAATYNRSANAYTNQDGTINVCFANYYKVGNKCLKVPENAYSLIGSVDWKCYETHQKIGNSCVKKSSSTNSSNAYIKITVPANAYAYGNSFKCYDGYKKNGNTCKKLTWKDGDYWDQEVRPGVSRLSAFGMLLSDMGNNNRGNSGFFKNSLINSSPGLKSSTGFGYRYGDQMYDTNNNFMGYIKNGVTYDESMRQTGFIRNNNIYNNTGNYIGPLGQDYKPGSVDFFD